MQDSVEYTWLHQQHINPRVTVLQRLVGLAKQCTRRLLLAAGLPDFYWSYAMRFVAEMLRHKALGFQWHVPAFWRRGWYVAIT